MRYYPSIAVTLTTCLVLAGCRNSEPVVPEIPDAPTRVTVQASNRFACELLKQLANEQPNSNLFFSPWSISGVLALCVEGAQGKTALEMGEALGFSEDLRQKGDKPWNLDGYHAGFATLMRRYAALQTSQKHQAMREKLAGLRTQLDTLNAKVRSERDFETALALQNEAVKLAATINELQKQIDPFELNLAMAVWAEKNYQFNEDYRKSLARYYAIDALQTADFIHQFPAERSNINQWVETQTKNKIRDLVPNMDPAEAKLVRMILVNAIYFRGQWSDPFYKSGTTSQPFLDSAGGEADIPLMARYGDTGYAAFNGDGSYFATPHSFSKGDKTYPDEGGFQIAELPYKGDKLAMTVILPRNIEGLSSLENALTGQNLERWLAKLEKRTVDLKLPKFKIATNYALVEPLKRMGMKEAFSLQANFHGIAKPADPNDDLHISQVVHKAFVEVNEEGTEAAAAASGRFQVKSAAERMPFIPLFRADHPFLFLIRDTDSGAILFVGQMSTAATQ